MLEIFTAIGGTAVVIAGLSNWLGRVWATRIASEESQKFQLKFDAIKREKDHLFDSLKSASFRYSDSQFGLYNELWRSLVDLKTSADSLWEQVSAKKVKDFSIQVKETSDAIERSALLIEDDHYQKLKNIIKQFEDFQFGKQRLVDLRNHLVHQNDVDENEIRYTIDDNRQRKEEFTALLNELRTHFKKQISGANIT
ncbi:MAG: hypothetical protein GY694_21560 [Gammaproteobacteria bacterium]|nr:hypothetical protein [Gammaproteobacteria bacterium]